MLSDHLSDVAEEMARRSAKIRRDFAQHRQSAGENREGLVRRFLEDHLPSRFGVDTGFVVSSDGRFSKQADLLIVDKENNAPLHSGYRHRLWPVESVYVLIEVKTRLSPREMDDAISKGQRFKSLPREFCRVRSDQHISESLFAIWAFEAPKPATVKENLAKRLAQVDISEQPDLVVVPDRLVAHLGSYRELVRLGQPGSEYRRDLEHQYQGDVSSLVDQPLDVYDLSKYSLLVWYVWLDSWLRQAGGRFCDPIKYLPPDQQFGTHVK